MVEYQLTKLKEVLQSRSGRLPHIQSTRSEATSLILNIVLKGSCDTVVRKALCQFHDSDQPCAHRNLVANMTEAEKLLLGRLLAIFSEGPFFLNIERLPGV